MTVTQKDMDETLASFRTPGQATTAIKRTLRDNDAVLGVNTARCANARFLSHIALVADAQLVQYDEAAAALRAGGFKVTKHPDTNWISAVSVIAHPSEA